MNFAKCHIILAVSDKAGKNIAFVTDTFKVLSLKEAITYTKADKIFGVHIVNASNGQYIRSCPNKSQDDNLDSLSVPAGSLSSQLSEPTSRDKVVDTYLRLRGKYFESIHEQSELLYLDGIAHIPREDIQRRIGPLIKTIKESALHQGVDHKLLTAILIDELARTGPDDLFDILGYIGVNASVGLAQVKITTARLIIAEGYFEASGNISTQRLYQLLINDHRAVEFAAGYLHLITDHRRKHNASLAPKAIATDYSRGHSTKNPKARGRTIVDKLIPLANELFEF